MSDAELALRTSGFSSLEERRGNLTALYFPEETCQSFPSGIQGQNDWEWLKAGPEEA